MQKQTCFRVGTVRWGASKTVEHGLIADGVDLEYSSSSRYATVFGSAVQISRVVHGQPGIRVRAVRVASKAVKHSFNASRIDLEDRPLAVITTRRSCAVEVPGAIHDQ